MTTMLTSRVPDALLAAKTRLDAQTWPVHSVLNRTPQISLADEEPQSYAEIVSIVSDVGDDASITWRSLPGGRDEEFDLVFVITSATGDTDPTSVLTRLKTLLEVLQRAFYDDTAATFNDAINPLGLNGATKLEAITQVKIVVVPADRIDGYIGQAEMVYRVFARI